MANHPTSGRLSHEKVETNSFLLIVLVLLVVAFGGLVEIVPLFFQKTTTQPLENMKPPTALQVAGRDIYLREGCYNCHSQMVRPFRAETLRYGPYSVAGESVWDHPFQWGSKRTGPDLARVGGRYSDEWHYQHLYNPRDVVPESNMPAYPWLAKNTVNENTISAHMTALRRVGVPFTDEAIAGAPEAVKGKTEMEAVIAYLQSLGLARTGQLSSVQSAAQPAPAAAPAAPAPAAAPQADASAVAPVPAAAAADEAAVKVENGVVQFFFATGKKDVAQGGTEALADVIAGVKAGKKAVITGYTDATGNAAQNEELAKERAFAVRDLLLSAGLTEDQASLQKPADNNAGAGGQARRVDVALQ